METKIKFKAFGKTKAKTVKKMASKASLSHEELLESQSQRVEEAINKVETEGKGRVGNVYKMKKLITGENQKGQEPVAVRNPKDGELIVEPNEIKKVTLQYCQDNLKKVKKSDKYITEEEVKQKLHNIRMNDKDEDGFKVDEDDFEEVIQRFKSKATKAYDFITKADEAYRSALFLVCKKFIDLEEFPDSFSETVLHMVWKKKAAAEILKNNRFIHMKHPLARTCEALIFNQSKKDIFEQSSIYQIGGQSGHAPEEHVFTLKSIIGLMQSKGKGLILNLVDIISFFDREEIIDVIEALENMKVNKKVLRLWYKLNNNTEIRVKTSVGMTESAQVGALIGQGSGGAAVGSQAMVDMGLRQYLAGSADEFYNGDVRVESAAFQDDIAKPNHDVISAQVGMTPDWQESFTKPHLFQRNRLTGSGNPSFESYVEGKAL